MNWKELTSDNTQFLVKNRKRYDGAACSWTDSDSGLTIYGTLLRIGAKGKVQFFIGNQQKEYDQSELTDFTITPRDNPRPKPQKTTLEIKRSPVSKEKTRVQVTKKKKKRKLVVTLKPEAQETANQYAYVDTYLTKMTTKSNLRTKMANSKLLPFVEAIQGFINNQDRGENTIKIKRYLTDYGVSKRRTVDPQWYGIQTIESFVLHNLSPKHPITNALLNVLVGFYSEAILVNGEEVMEARDKVLAAWKR